MTLRMVKYFEFPSCIESLRGSRALVLQLPGQRCMPKWVGSARRDHIRRCLHVGYPTSLFIYLSSSLSSQLSTCNLYLSRWTPMEPMSPTRFMLRPVHSRFLGSSMHCFAGVIEQEPVASAAMLQNIKTRASGVPCCFQSPRQATLARVPSAWPERCVGMARASCTPAQVFLSLHPSHLRYSSKITSNGFVSRKTGLVRPFQLLTKRLRPNIFCRNAGGERRPSINAEIEEPMQHEHWPESKSSPKTQPLATTRLVDKDVYIYI